MMPKGRYNWLSTNKHDQSRTGARTHTHTRTHTPVSTLQHLSGFGESCLELEIGRVKKQYHRFLRIPNVSSAHCSHFETQLWTIQNIISDLWDIWGFGGADGLASCSRNYIQASMKLQTWGIFFTFLKHFLKTTCKLPSSCTGNSHGNKCLTFESQRCYKRSVWITLSYWPLTSQIVVSPLNQVKCSNYTTRLFTTFNI